jgi:hypothetical protein
MMMMMIYTKALLHWHCLRLHISFGRSASENILGSFNLESKTPQTGWLQDAQNRLMNGAKPHGNDVIDDGGVRKPTERRISIRQLASDVKTFLGAAGTPHA